MNEVRKAYPVSSEKDPLHISLAGITYPDPTYHIQRKSSNISVIEYILDGEGLVFHRGEWQRVTKDMIYFLPAGCDHEYMSDPDNPFTKIWMNIDSGALCSHLISVYGLSDRHFFEGNGLKVLFEKILITIHSENEDNEQQASLNGIFTEIIARLSQQIRFSEHSDEAMRLMKYLNSNTHRMVSGKELCAVIFRSPDYCLKLFSEEFGITPYAYQLERKMEVARSLLTNTSLSVKEIAETVGYGDPQYFSNIFKTKCGLSPLSFRKKSRD
ncbi:MAG: AraC family transcriptional regulator [Acutalibacteraceae bacterium]|nr:AraC family transcriptional regulator [Acutalibacteraceae bacterium]